MNQFYLFFCFFFCRYYKGEKKIHYEIDVWIPDLNIGFEYQVILKKNN